MSPLAMFIRTSIRVVAILNIMFWSGMLSLSHNTEGEDNVFPCPEPQSIDWVPAHDVPYTLLA
jgi:hypothetical protein